jgi:hypothetical protein
VNFSGELRPLGQAATEGATFDEQADELHAVRGGLGETTAISSLDNVAPYVESGPRIPRSRTLSGNYRAVMAMRVLPEHCVTAREQACLWQVEPVEDESNFPGTLPPSYMLLQANQFPNS